MPTTSPSIGDQRPARVARVGRGVELDQVGQQRACPRGERNSRLQAGDDARRDRRADAEREARRRPLRRPGAGPSSSAAWPAARSSGTVFAWSTARSCSGCMPTTVASDSSPSENITCIALRPGDDVQVREDHALVDDDDPGADAAARCPRPSSVVAQPVHAHDRRPDRLVGLRRAATAAASSRACAAPRRRCPSG